MACTAKRLAPESYPEAELVLKLLEPLKSLSRSQLLLSKTPYIKPTICNPLGSRSFDHGSYLVFSRAPCQGDEYF